MGRPDEIVLALMLASCLASGLANGQASSPPAPKATSTWNASTTPPAPRPPAEDSVLSLRLYGEGNKKALPPYQTGPRRRDDPAYAVDVSAVMTHCPDGSLVITGLVIGGQLTPLDARCPAGPGNTSVKPAPACDANRWNCTTTPDN